MDSYPIAEGLRIDKDPRGAMVHYLIDAGGGADAFAIGLSHKSLRACQKALGRATASWATNDGGFRVVKNEGKITLVFKLQGPPYGSRELELAADEASRFEEAVASLAGG